VDLTAPDDQLEIDFTAVLRTLRKTQPAPIGHGLPALNWKPKRKRKYTSRPKPITKEILLKMKTIQFLDLLIWEEQNGCKISPKAKSRLLFPYSGEGFVDRGSSVDKRSQSKVTKAESVQIENWNITEESRAWSLMENSDSSCAELERLAEKQLVNAYKRGNADNEFVPTKKMRSEIEKALSPE
jgi:hypothetical protein